MRFAVLGPLDVSTEGGDPVDLGGRQPRVVVAALLAARGRPVQPDVLVDAVWGGSPPASAVGTLQSYISRLRKQIDGDPSVRLGSDDRGYRLEVDPDALDLDRFERLVDHGRRLLDARRPEDARVPLADALSLWRGTPFPELADHEATIGLTAALEERRLRAVEDWCDAELACGRPDAVAAALPAIVEAHPLRESLRAKQALALYRAGRQAEALRALGDARRALVEELGIEPSRPLRDLEAAILTQDPLLDRAAGAATTAAAAAPPAAALGAPRGPREVVAADGGATRPAAGPGSTMVGRGAELAQLVAALDAAPEDARFVVIEGDPGIGKTRLADEVGAVARARGSLVVWGRADESGAAPALWPWLPLLRELGARHGALPAVLDDLVAGDVPLVAGQGAALQFERFEALVEVLDEAGAAAPVVMLLDDLQWADATSVELLSFLVSRARRRLLVVITVRPMEVGRRDAVTEVLGAIVRRRGSARLFLRGLAPDDTAALLRGATAAEVSGAVTRRIHERAEGNPFYAVELARLYVDGGEDEVPTSVADVIRCRLVRLPDATVDLLGTAAVVGRDVDVQLLARSAGIDLDECFDLLDPAVSHRLLVEVADQPGKLRFRHALVREVLLEGLTSLRRARIHLRVADAMEAMGAGDDDAEFLAEHLWRAAPVGVGKRAAAALERAAEVAVRRVSYPTAESLLLRAVQIRRAASTTEEEQRDEMEAAVRLLNVTMATRSFQAADQDVLARAMALAEHFGDDALFRQLLWFQGAGLQTAARVHEAEGPALALLARTADHPEARIRALGHQQYAVVCWGQGRIAEAVDHIDRAMALFEDAPPPVNELDAEQRLVTRSFVLVHHGLRGDWPLDEVFARYDAIIAVSPPYTVSSTCGFAGTTALCLGRWDRVEHYLVHSLRADPASQFAFWGGQGLMRQGILDVRAGDLDTGIARFAEGDARYVGVGAFSGIPTFRSHMGLVLAEAGRMDEAQRHLEGARRGLEERGELWNLPLVLIAEAVVAGLQGDDGARSKLLAEAVDTAGDQGAQGVAARAAALLEGC